MYDIKPGMESSRHLPRLEAVFFSWLGLTSKVETEARPASVST